MNKILLSLILITSSKFLVAQCQYAASNGDYTVNIDLIPTTINRPVCPGNLTLGVDYVITFTGTNPPAALYYLNAVITCNGSPYTSNTLSVPLPSTQGAGSTVSGNTAYSSYECGPTHSPKAFGCNTVTFSGTGPNFDLAGSPPCALSPLKVELISFIAQPLGTNEIGLAWKTATETQNDFFQIERSTNGINWISIGKIAGNGNTSQEVSYHFTDLNPNTGVNFYRLKQVETSGNFSFSAIRSATTHTKYENLSVFPNPTNGNIQVKGVFEGNNTLQLFNLLGELVQVNAISQNISLGTVELNLEQLQPGVYILKSGARSQRIVKQ